MSILSNSNAISADGAYKLTDSLRFRASATAYLSRTPASAGNRKTWTWSAWFKRGQLPSATSSLFGSGTGGGDYCYLGFNSSQILQFQNNASGGNQINATTPAVFRDVSAWYHIVLSVDTTQATNSNGIKIYINGVQQTLSFTSYTQNTDTLINNTNTHVIGDYISGGSLTFDGYMTEVNFVDGQALDPTSFGETNDNGVWSPIEYTGTYGTNGFYLNFSDGTSTTTLGYDYSGNSNNWTTNNVSLTAGTTYDLMSDVPFPVNEDTGNFCTLNPLDVSVGSGAVYYNGNLDVSYTNILSGISGNSVGTIGVNTGKWIFEATVSSYTGVSTLSVGWWGTTYLTRITPSANGVYTVAIDFDNQLVWFATNGTWTGDPEAGTGGTSITVDTSIPYFPLVRDNSGTIGNGAYFATNFGQRPFAYTPPAGFKKLNTYNLPDSAIPNGSEYFKTVLYTGNGTSQNITSVGFTPDLVWHKGRSVAYSPSVVDSVRGDSNVMFPSATNAEQNPGAQLDIITDGFTTTYRSANNANNQSGQTYVAWNWKGSDSSPVTNTDGTITSTVSANTTSGFSVVTYTSPASGNYTVGHGLGTQPAMIINKCRGSSSAWAVWHKELTGGTSNKDYYLLLNSTAAEASVTDAWGASAPTSDVFGMNAGGSAVASQTQVAYCFAEVEGFSSFGSYTGNGNADGTFIYTGFRPAFVMVKRTNSTGNWNMLDTTRSPYNPNFPLIYANLSNAEVAVSTFIDVTANGFKFRTTGTDFNNSGDTYIYMAFAENPFKNSLAR